MMTIMMMMIRFWAHHFKSMTLNLLQRVVVEGKLSQVRDVCAQKLHHSSPGFHNFSISLFLFTFQKKIAIGFWWFLRLSCVLINNIFPTFLCSFFNTIFQALLRKGCLCEKHYPSSSGGIFSFIFFLHIFSQSLFCLQHYIESSHFFSKLLIFQICFENYDIFKYLRRLE